MRIKGLFIPAAHQDMPRSFHAGTVQESGEITIAVNSLPDREELFYCVTLTREGKLLESWTIPYDMAIACYEPDPEVEVN